MSRELEPNSTGIPNVILDRWMPLLSPSELVVVMYVCRKTYGWGKTFDRIGAAQMQRETGLSRDTVFTTCQELQRLCVLKIASSRDGVTANAYRLNRDDETATLKNLEARAQEQVMKKGKTRAAKSPTSQTNTTSQKSRLVKKTDGVLVRNSDPSRENGEDKDPQCPKKDIAPKGARFVPPTLEEAESYFAEKGYPQLGAVFWNHYEGVNWYSGKAKIGKWRATAANWVTDEKTGRRSSGRASPGPGTISKPVTDPYAHLRNKPNASQTPPARTIRPEAPDAATGDQRTGPDRAAPQR